MNLNQENCPVHAVPFLPSFFPFFSPELADPRFDAEAGEKEHKLQDGRLVIRTYEAHKVETCFTENFINEVIVRVLVLSLFCCYLYKRLRAIG